MSENSRVLQPQWDVGQSVFGGATVLRRLIEATGAENVHPQAVLAAEALGSGIFISKHRYSEAIDALEGNKNLRIDALKALIGLQASSLKKAMRESSSLIHFFVLVAACKPCFLDEEIASIVFEMMVKSDLLSKYPVSAGQLTSLVEHLSGSAETIVPMSVMNSVASAAADHPTGRSTFERLSASTLAQFFVTLFECVREQTVTAVVVHAQVHAIWMSTGLLWLLEDEVSPRVPWKPTEK
ncbi:MAG: hypothetical protein Q9162_004808 [Coniocarpon cinnabarinum]